MAVGLLVTACLSSPRRPTGSESPGQGPRDDAAPRSSLTRASKASLPLPPLRAPIGVAPRRPGPPRALATRLSTRGAGKAIVTRAGTPACPRAWGAGHLCWGDTAAPSGGPDVGWWCHGGSGTCPRPLSSSAGVGGGAAGRWEACQPLLCSAGPGRTSSVSAAGSPGMSPAGSSSHGSRGQGRAGQRSEPWPRDSSSTPAWGGDQRVGGSSLSGDLRS